MRGIFMQSIVVGFLIPLCSWAADRRSPDVPVTQNPRIFVIVVNSAAVPDHSLSEAEERVGEILTNVGVEVEWIDCQRPINTSVCTGTAEADRLVLTIGQPPDVRRGCPRTIRARKPR